MSLYVMARKVKWNQMARALNSRTSFSLNTTNTGKQTTCSSNNAKVHSVQTSFHTRMRQMTLTKNKRTSWSQMPDRSSSDYQTIKKASHITCSNNYLNSLNFTLSYKTGAYLFSNHGDKSNPTLRLQRLKKYKITLNNSTAHPFRIQSDNIFNGTLYSTGLSHSDGTTDVNAQEKIDGVLTFPVPKDAPDTLYYICQNHAAMVGKIEIISNPLIARNKNCGSNSAAATREMPTPSGKNCCKTRPYRKSLNSNIGRLKTCTITKPQSGIKAAMSSSEKIRRVKAAIGNCAAANPNPLMTTRCRTTG